MIDFNSNNKCDPWEYKTPQTQTTENELNIKYLQQALDSMEISCNNTSTGLENLELQSETLNNIHNNLGMLNNKLDISDHKLKLIANPLSKHNKLRTNQPALISNNFAISGNIKKYTKTFKHWYNSRCTLDIDTFVYQRLVKSNDIRVNLKNCTFKFISNGDKLYDGSTSKYNNVLEITEIMYTSGELKYHAFRTAYPHELDAFINYLVYHAGYEIEGIKSKESVCDKETILLDMLNGKIDKLSILSENMTTIIDEHNDNIKIISDTMDNSHARIINYTDKTKTLH